MYFCSGEMAEWLNAAVLKTVLRQRNGGSNPSFSAKHILKCFKTPQNESFRRFFYALTFPFFHLFSLSKVPIRLPSLQMAFW